MQNTAPQAPQTPEQQQQQQQAAAYQAYLYQQQMQQYTQAQQATQTQQPTATPGYPPQYSQYPPTAQYPQYLQQPPAYPPQYQPQQYQNHGYQQSSAQHSDRVLWVGNLHQEVDDNELRNTFSQYGTIENIKLVHTKACGFITFADPQAATRAHTEMNHTQIHGQEIKIGWGKAENPQGGFGQSQYGNPGGGYDPQQQRPRLPDVNKELPQMAPSRALWVGNVTQQLSEPMLRQLFSQYGNIESVRMMVQKNCAFITYATIDEATLAKQSLDKYRVADTQIRVNFGKA